MPNRKNQLHQYQDKKTVCLASPSCQVAKRLQVNQKPFEVVGKKYHILIA
jgi:hypothetical protein